MMRTKQPSHMWIGGGWSTWIWEIFKWNDSLETCWRNFHHISGCSLIWDPNGLTWFQGIYGLFGDIPTTLKERMIMKCSATHSWIYTQKQFEFSPCQVFALSFDKSPWSSCSASNFCNHKPTFAALSVRMFPARIPSFFGSSRQGWWNWWIRRVIVHYCQWKGKASW